jgi:hypothetical protein
MDQSINICLERLRDMVSHDIIFRCIIPWRLLSQLNKKYRDENLMNWLSSINRINLSFEELNDICCNQESIDIFVHFLIKPNCVIHDTLDNILDNTFDNNSMDDSIDNNVVFTNVSSIRDTIYEEVFMNYKLNNRIFTSCRVNMFKDTNKSCGFSILNERLDKIIMDENNNISSLIELSNIKELNGYIIGELDIRFDSITTLNIITASVKKRIGENRLTEKYKKDLEDLCKFKVMEQLTKKWNTKVEHDIKVKLYDVTIHSMINSKKYFEFHLASIEKEIHDRKVDWNEM